MTERHFLFTIKHQKSAHETTRKPEWGRGQQQQQQGASHVVVWRSRPFSSVKRKEKGRLRQTSHVAGSIDASRSPTV